MFYIILNFVEISRTIAEISQSVVFLVKCKNLLHDRFQRDSSLPHPVELHCVPKKVSPLNILQQPLQTCTNLNEILHTQDDIYFCHRRQIS